VPSIGIQIVCGNRRIDKWPRDCELSKNDRQLIANSARRCCNRTSLARFVFIDIRKAASSGSAIASLIAFVLDKVGLISLCVYVRLYSVQITQVAVTKVIENFREKYLKKKTASDMDADAAIALLGHSSKSTTDRHYRLHPQKVVPRKLSKD
jgi:integrase